MKWFFPPHCFIPTALSSEAARRQEEEQNQRSVFADFEEDDEPEPTRLGTDTGNPSSGSQPQVISHPDPTSVPSGLSGGVTAKVRRCDGTKQKTSSGAASTPCTDRSGAPVSPVIVTLNEPRYHDLKLWDMSDPIYAVHAKLRCASDELERTTSAGNSIQLCKLIKKCAKTLEALQNINHQAN